MLPKVHLNPYWRTSEASFRADALALAERMPTYSRSRQYAELMRLMARIDGHTGVYPFEAGFHLYRLRLYTFSDGVFVLAAPGHPELVGGRVVRIGATPTDEALRRVAPFSARDNEMTVKVVAPMLLVTPEVLDAAGISGPFAIATAKGEVTFNPATTDWNGFADDPGGIPVGLPQDNRLLFLKHRNRRAWWTWLAERRALYLQENQVLAVAETVDAVRSALDRHPHARLILDLRNNPGGDNTTYGPLLDLVQANDRPGRVAILIGRQTFSAAMNFVTAVEQSTDHIRFVGEPTGGRPNLYGDVQPLTLPESGMLVQISSRYWQKSTPDDQRDWIAPDLPVAFASADYFSGNDPVLAAALR